MDYSEESLEKHREWRGKLETVPKMKIEDRHALSVAYTPGVARPCIEIQKDPSLSYELTGRGNLVAVITDGTAVLGLGDIGPEAAMPVMEGKCALFKTFGGVDAVPLCVRSKDVDEFVRTVSLLAGSFGGINLEDISAPRCFEIERRLKQVCDIPVFHDDQHGTAVVVLAAVMNAMRLTGRNISNVRAVINGAGAAGIAIAELLMKNGLKDVTMCNRSGIICEGADSLNPAQAEIAKATNLRRLRGGLADAMKGADLFIGVSGPGLVTGEMVRSMAKDPILFPMANPVPEIMPDEAVAAGAYIVGTGRSDFPNQINNVMAFPGIFRGALDVRASDINTEMQIAAAKALSGLVSDGELSREYILPEAFDKRIAPAVSAAVADAARRSGCARI